MVVAVAKKSASDSLPGTDSSKITHSRGDVVAHAPALGLQLNGAHVGAGGEDEARGLRVGAGAPEGGEGGSAGVSARPLERIARSRSIHQAQCLTLSESVRCIFTVLRSV